MFPPNRIIFRHNRAAFSLLEVIIVAGIMVVILSLVTPVFRSEKSASTAAYEVAGVFNRARAYAMANSAYVYVGLFEEDGSRPSVGPGGSAPAGVGRVVMAAVATKDGMTGYDEANKTWAAYDDGGNLLALDKLWRFEGLSVSGTRLGDTGGMARPSLAPNGILVSGSTVALTPFTWPLGKAQGSGQYHFQAVICFGPQGVARVLDEDHQSFTSIPSVLEIGFATAHGNAVRSGSNVAVVQIDAMTGATRVYRP